MTITASLIIRNDLNFNRAYSSEDMKEFNNFVQIAKGKKIFPQSVFLFESECLVNANRWYSFSKVMPQILINCSKNIDFDQHKESFLQIAKEELGGDFTGIPHSTLFLNSCRNVGLELSVVNISELNDLLIYSQSKRNFSLLGLSFGLEIIANENIDFLLSSISIGESNKIKLRNTLFFQVHMQNEDEHIKATFDNFKNYCHSEEDKKSFEEGFLFGLNFWKKFWSKK